MGECEWRRERDKERGGAKRTEKRASEAWLGMEGDRGEGPLGGGVANPPGCPNDPGEV